MALLESQRRQLHRLAIADGAFGTSDRHAMHGIPEALSPGLTAAQLRQWHRIPIADSTVSTGDRWTLHGITQTIAVGGPVIDLFEVTWKLDPSWTALLLPQTVDGSIVAEIGGYSVSFTGRVGFIAPPVDDLVASVQIRIASALIGVSVASGRSAVSVMQAPLGSLGVILASKSSSIRTSSGSISFQLKTKTTSIQI